MTTMAYDHERLSIAVDCRITMDGVICSESSDAKVFENAEGVWFFSGVVADYHLFRECFSKGRSGHTEIYNCYAFYFDRATKQLFLRSIDDKGVANNCPINYNYALGSGSNFALAALDFGKTAADAVVYASTRDNCTGANVIVFDIKSNTRRYIERIKFHVENV